MSGGQGEYLLVDATLQFRTDLGKLMAEQYPLIRPGDQQALDAYRAQDGMVSFSLVGSPGFVGQIISAALDKASDPASVAHCEHGAEHLAFPAAIDHLQADLRAGTAEATIQNSHGPVAGELHASFQRLVVTGPQETVTVHMPGPAAEATRLRGMDPVGQARQLRRDSINEGVPFGMMTGIYARAMTQREDVFGFFGNPQFADNIKETGQDRPIESRAQDRKLVDDVLGVLIEPTRRGLVPSMNPADYRAACDNFVERGWLTTEQTQSPPYAFEPVALNAQPLAVFAGATERAQNLASPDFLSPARDQFIDTQYGGLMTTQLITGYLKFD